MKTILLTILMLCTQLLVAQTFMEVTDTPFEQLRGTTLAFADADGDGDEDIFLNGSTGINSPYIAKLYLNDGNDTFIEMAETPFVGKQIGSVIFSDLNGDGHPDVLLSGYDNNFNTTMSFYTNDGMANFTEVTNLAIAGAVNGEMATSDVDNDNDLDILVTGYGGGTAGTAKLYLNDGASNFTEMMNTPFVGVEGGALDFADVDGDGDEDVLISGFTSGFPLVNATSFYLNDGEGNFSLVEETPFIDVNNGSVAFSDIDLDGDADVLLSGSDGSSTFTKLYVNDGTGNFMEVAETPFVQVSHGSIDFADIDNDGDKDVLITGNGSGASISTKLYINDGMGNFTVLADTPFPGLSGSAAGFSDLDKDGNLDVLLSGYNGSTASTKLYLTSNSVSVDEKLAINLQAVTHPNPFQHTITIDLPQNWKGNYRLIDVRGKSWIENSFNGDQIMLENLEQLPQGTYFLDIQGEGFKAVQKVLKL